MSILLLAISALSIGAASPCVRFSGEHILASDVAKAFPPFLQLAPDTRIARAPNPGSLRTLWSRDLRHASLAHPELEIPEEFQACFEWELHELKAGELLEPMRQAFSQEGVKLDILEYGPQQIPPGKLIFPRNSLMPPALSSKDGLTTWRGYVEYAPARREPVWARVRVRVPGQRVVAAINLNVGEEIRADQVRLEMVDEFPAANAGRIERLEDVVGQSLRRSVTAGMPIQRTLLTAPKIVTKGETVELRVRSGRMNLRLDVRAETSGGQGDFVLFRNAENGKLIRARMEARGQAVLDLSRPGSIQGDR